MGPNRSDSEWKCCFGLHVRVVTIVIGYWHLVSIAFWRFLNFVLVHFSTRHSVVKHFVFVTVAVDTFCMSKCVFFGNITKCPSFEGKFMHFSNSWEFYNFFLKKWIFYFDILWRLLHLLEKVLFYFVVSSQRVLFHFRRPSHSLPRQ